MGVISKEIRSSMIDYFVVLQ